MQGRLKQTQKYAPGVDVMSTIEESPRSPALTDEPRVRAGPDTVTGTSHMDLAARRWAAELEAKRKEWLGW